MKVSVGDIFITKNLRHTEFNNIRVKVKEVRSFDEVVLERVDSRNRKTKKQFSWLNCPMVLVGTNFKLENNLTPV